jgi:hypothetical protein
MDAAIQLPPLSFSRRSPPQNSFGPRKDDPETVTCTPLKEETAKPVTPGGIAAPQRLQTAAYPRKSS